MPSAVATCVSTCTVAGVSGWDFLCSHTITITITPYLVLLLFFFNVKHINHSARLVSANYNQNAIATQCITVLVGEGIVIYLISNSYPYYKDLVQPPALSPNGPNERP